MHVCALPLSTESTTIYSVLWSLLLACGSFCSFQSSNGCSVGWGQVGMAPGARERKMVAVYSGPPYSLLN